MSTPAPMAGMTYAIPAFAESAIANENGRKVKPMASLPPDATPTPIVGPIVPEHTLTARDQHAAEALRLIARKIRSTDPDGADKLERKAKSFDTWRQAYMRR